MNAPRRRNDRPLLEHEVMSQAAASPKPIRQSLIAGPVDTRELALRKIHPERDRAYLDWLRRQECAVKRRVDTTNGQAHQCWNPESSRGLNDPAHCGKAFSGALKQSDHGAFTLCRAAHQLQELSMAGFDRRYGIDRYEIAAKQYVAYLDDKERKAR